MTSKITPEQKTILNLFSEGNHEFLIPDYQRPYSWTEDECSALWDDLLGFCIPDFNTNLFDDSSEYFLGPIVTFFNNGKHEVIDGQQRLTTLLILLRAFYPKFEEMNDDYSKNIYKDIERCIRKTNGRNVDKDLLKIDSDVALDEYRQQFISILKTGKNDNNNSSKNRYSENYKFFTNKIEEFIEHYPMYLKDFLWRILHNCYLLWIQAGDQENALGIFSTLNDRGKPLSDTDIFKAKLYKYFLETGKKEDFIEDRKSLEKICKGIFDKKSGSEMDELFIKYMYYLRACEGITSTSIMGLRRFYEGNGGIKYKYLKDSNTFENLKNLANFWYDVKNLDDSNFSVPVKKKLFILNSSSNVVWTYIVSTYFLVNKDEKQELDQEKFSKYLDKLICFVLTYTIIQPGVSSIKAIAYEEMVRIKNNKTTALKIDEKKYSFDIVNRSFCEYNFTKTITRSILTWWMLWRENANYSFKVDYDIEHIFAKKRNQFTPLSKEENLESIGNKILLEKKINISAQAYRFSEKKYYYMGKNKNGKLTKNKELLELCNKVDFDESDIEYRKNNIINSFLEYIINEGVLSGEKNEAYINYLDLEEGFKGQRIQQPLISDSKYNEKLDGVSTNNSVALDSIDINNIEFYFRREKRCMSKMIVRDGKYIVKKGSKISEKITSNINAIVRQRNKLSPYISEDYITLKDIRFKKPSSAGEFVYGAASNGRNDWVVNINGKILSLGDILGKK